MTLFYCWSIIRQETSKLSVFVANDYLREVDMPAFNAEFSNRRLLKDQPLWDGQLAILHGLRKIDSYDELGKEVKQNKKLARNSAASSEVLRAHFKLLVFNQPSPQGARN